MKEEIKIKRPEIFRFKLRGFRKNTIAYRSCDDWNYNHSFSIIYQYLRVSMFFKCIGWQYREKKIYIPKILNNLLRLIFGKVYYSVHRLEDGHGYCTEMVRSKAAKEYIREFKESGFTDIYISSKERRYSGWLWITKKEKKTSEAILNFNLNMWSYQPQKKHIKT